MSKIILPLVLFFGAVAFALVEPELTPEEKECLEKSQVYHKPTKKCYALLEDGPCAKGEWFVLRRPLEDEEEIIIEGVCEKNRCVGRRAFFWSETQSCVTSDDKTRLCGASDSVQLGTNNFGDGECVCDKNTPRVRFRDQCEELYQRGPCKRGEIVAFPNTDAVDPECVPDPCYKESRERKAAGTLALDATLAMYKGTCHILNTKGPCEEKMVFKVSLATQGLACAQLTHAIFNIEKPQNCVQDPSGGCQTPVHVKQPGSDSYREQLFASMSAHRRERVRSNRKQTIFVEEKDEVVEEVEYDVNTA